MPLQQWIQGKYNIDSNDLDSNPTPRISASDLNVRRLSFNEECSSNIADRTELGTTEDDIIRSNGEYINILKGKERWASQVDNLHIIQSL